jgi:hypothetical protein
MYDAQPIEESYKRIVFGERAGGEVVRLFIGERGQVLRTEAHRGDEWVRVEHAPKPLRITHQMVQVGNVLLMGGPPPDMATPGEDQ